MEEEERQQKRTFRSNFICCVDENFMEVWETVSHICAVFIVVKG